MHHDRSFSLSLSSDDCIHIDRELARRSLAEFVKMTWHLMEPAAVLKWGWVLDAVCEHLEAITRGTLNRNLVANVPPGSMKSLLVNVFWPCWEWGPMDMGYIRHTGTAHEEGLAIRDNRKARALIKSDFFQQRWPLVLDPAVDGKKEFGNMDQGFMIARAFTSMTGRRADRVKLDDPISAFHANSEAHIAAARIAFLETLPTRVNNEDSRIVVIMQRLNEKDVTGIILEKELDYEHLVIPMEYELGRVYPVSSMGWKDPRTEDGELMFPERFSRKQVDELKKTLGSYGVAGQLQQRPSPRGGGLLKRRWFTVKPAAPSGCVWVRAWDLAATESKDAARTAGVKMGRAPDGTFWVGHVAKGQLSAADVERLLLNTASQDGINVRGSIPQDPGQAGKAQAQYLIKQLAGYSYTSSPESGDKITRAQPLAAQAEAGNVFLVAGDWNEDFLSELETFPSGKFKDQVDAASRAFAELLNASDYNWEGAI